MSSTGDSWGYGGYRRQGSTRTSNYPQGTESIYGGYGGYRRYGKRGAGQHAGHSHRTRSTYEGYGGGYRRSGRRGAGQHTGHSQRARWTYEGYGGYGHSGRQGANQYSDSQRAESPYEVLQVRPGASQKEISAAYRRLAQLHHPDKVATLTPEVGKLADRRMKEINAARDQLKRRLP